MKVSQMRHILSQMGDSEEIAVIWFERKEFGDWVGEGDAEIPEAVWNSAVARFDQTVNDQELKEVLEIAIYDIQKEKKNAKK